MSESDNKTILFLLDGYYDRLSAQLEKKYGNNYLIQLKRWCIEQAIKIPNKDTIPLAENIEGYILNDLAQEQRKEFPQERFDKMKDEKPDLSKIEKLIKDGQESHKSYQEEMDRKFTASFEYLAGKEWLSKQADDAAKEFKEKNRNK